LINDAVLKEKRATFGPEISTPTAYFLNLSRLRVVSNFGDSDRGAGHSRPQSYAVFFKLRTSLVALVTAKNLSFLIGPFKLYA